jgi:hypothetical protein
MRTSPSIVPLDRLDREIYLVLEDFGARAGCAWRETDEADTDLETVIRHILSGEYTYPVRRWHRGGQNLSATSSLVGDTSHPMDLADRQTA